MGDNGQVAQESMYRLACMTARQLACFAGISRSVAQKTLKSLERSRLASQRRSKLPWAPGRGRPTSIYYLSRGNYDSAIVEGAFAAGVEEEKRGRRMYARCQMPARAVHGWLRNEFYRFLIEHCEEAGAVVPPGLMWSESDPTFPISGPSGAAAGAVYPDGSIEVSWDTDLQCGFVVEAETRSRPTEVLDKIERYAKVLSSWRTGGYRAFDDQGGAERILGYEGFRPVLFLLPRASTAAGLLDRVRAVAAEEAAKPYYERKVLREYSLLDATWHKTCVRFGIEPGFRVGCFFLFVGLDQVQARGAFSDVYKPITPYPKEHGGAEVCLREPAEDVRSAHEVDIWLSRNGTRVRRY